jgi:hypothetical protein
MIDGAPANVLDYGAIGDGVADDTVAIQAALDANDSIYFPQGTYKVSATIRASRVVNINGDPEATIVAASGFTGISITKIGVAFTLKAIFAVFSGSDIGQQTNPRLGESGDKVTIGPMRLNCDNNCDYGVLINSCPGAQVSSNVEKANDTGIWAGPNTWGSAFWHNRITECVNVGIYLGEACNGAAIYSPEIWGLSIKTGVGIYLEGTVAGVIGAVGNVFVSGGYIEDCTNGVYLKNTGSVHLYSVDIESIDDHAVYADCSAGNTYGTITVNGCTLIAGDSAFYNSNAYINVFGCDINDGFVLTPYLSNSANSLFNIQGTRQFTSGGAPAPFPALTTTQTALANYETKYEARVDNKRLTDGAASFSRSYALYNFSSDSQPSEISSALEFRNSNSGDANNSYFSSAILRANKTTSDPTPRVSVSAAVIAAFLGSSVPSFYPETDDAIQLGAASNRWTTVYATTGTINTSDANDKQQIRDLNEIEKAVAIQLKGMVRSFKFNDAVEAKGDNARIHIGLIAQEVEQAFIDGGLNPEHYGIFCRDVWYMQGKEQARPLKDGSYPSDAIRHERLGIRYEELFAFVISTL